MLDSAAISQPPRWLALLGLIVMLGTLALGAAVLLDARRDTWQQAEQASSNLVLALERDIARTIATYDLSLQGAADAARLPGIGEISPELRHSTLFDRAATAEYLGSLLVLDATGDIVADSTAVTPHQLNFADRDYFTVHRDRTDAGLYVSRPFRSRLRGGDASIAISRRLSNADGTFAGAVVGTLRLAYFEDLFARLNVGARGSIALLGADGYIIARFPSLAAAWAWTCPGRKRPGASSKGGPGSSRRTPPWTGSSGCSPTAASAACRSWSTSPCRWTGSTGHGGARRS